MTNDSRVFVIAEAGSNWRAGTPESDRAMARDLVRVAADAGADAVKFQTYRAETTYVPDAGESGYLAASGIRQSINEIFADLEMPYELIAETAEVCDQAGIEFMSTPFSIADAAAVDPYVRRHKVASYEINHVRLLQWLAGTGKPLIISTGAATPEDIDFCMETVRSAGGGPVTLLQCTASYPAPVASLNLAVIPWLRERYGVQAGFSDHSLDATLGPVMAVALGASVVEKHFTMRNDLPGPDHAFALEPDGLVSMVRAIRDAEEAVGSGLKVVGAAEAELRDFAVRAVQATQDLTPGDVLVEGENFDLLRPGNRPAGMHPRHLAAIGGRTVVRHVPRGDGIGTGDVAPRIVE